MTESLSTKKPRWHGRSKHLVIASSSLLIVFCLHSLSIRLVVTCFSLLLDSLIEIGGVTPRYLSQDTCL